MKDFTRVNVDPGICGFPCVIQVRKDDARTVSIEISGSECKQIKKLAGQLKRMTMQELFLPVSKNSAFLFAQKFGCHPSCPVPVAVLKAVEVGMEMALPKQVRITFDEANRKIVS
jgi:uncharacterized protein DUF6951